MSPRSANSGVFCVNIKWIVANVDKLLKCSEIINFENVEAASARFWRGGHLRTNFLAASAVSACPGYLRTNFLKLPPPVGGAQQGI